MPPIPSTLDEDVRAQLESLERRQKDLQTFQIPRLRSFDGALATQQQYAAELREDIEAFARQLEVSYILTKRGVMFDKIVHDSLWK
jgi:protein transport protein SEC20